MSSTPLLDRVTSFIARLAERIAGFGDRAGRDQAARDRADRDPTTHDQPGLEPAHASILLARLRHLAERFRAIVVTPIPPPRRERKPVEPKFIPTHISRDPSEEAPPAPVRLPHARSWLLRLIPQTEAERAQLEDLLRDQATQERLAADPRLGRILRPLGWMLGVDRALLPPSGWRRRPLVLVLGGPEEVTAAVAEYAVARAKGETAAEVLALCCVWVPHRLDCGWDRRLERKWDGLPPRRRDSWLVWHGRAGPTLPGLARFSA